jgi:hypothetical protein
MGEGVRTLCKFSDISKMGHRIDTFIQKTEKRNHAMIRHQNHRYIGDLYL